MRIRWVLAAFLTLTIVTVPLLTSAYSLGMVDGVISHKAITGMQNNTSYGILLNRPIGEIPWILVEDKDLAEYFSDTDKNAVINESLGKLLEQKYSNIEYWVSIEPFDPDKSVQNYKVSREEFNKAQVGNPTD